MAFYIIKSVSLTKDHAEMVEKYHISLTAVLRQALNLKEKEIMGEVLDDNASLVAKVRRLTDYITKYTEFLEKRGLTNDFLQEPTDKQ